MNGRKIDSISKNGGYDAGALVNSSRNMTKPNGVLSCIILGICFLGISNGLYGMFKICFGADLYESDHCRSDVGDGRAIRSFARHCPPEMFSTNGGAGFKFSTGSTYHITGPPCTINEILM